MGGSGEPFDFQASRDGGEAGRIFQEAVAKMEASDEFVYDAFRRNVFISFDADDQGMVELLRSQAKDDRFPFEFRDYSVKEPFDDEWKARVRERIQKSSAVIVAIGENTHTSKAVDWEVREAIRQGKLVVGIRLHRDGGHAVPEAMVEHGCEVISWNTKEIADIINYRGSDD